MLKDAYCSVEEANGYINSQGWNALTDAERLVALKWGRNYLDSHYKQKYEIDEDDESYTDFDNARKLGCALLASHFVVGELFVASASNNQQVIEKTSKAGSVSTTKRYASSGGTVAIDPFPEVTSVLSEFFYRIASSFSMANAIRG